MEVDSDGYIMRFKNAYKDKILMVEESIGCLILKMV